MENHIKLNPPTNDYLIHFRMAWMNLEKLSRDERKRMSMRRKRPFKRQA